MKSRIMALASGARPIRSFRSHIVPQLFDPFVSALSRALSRMPALRRLEVELGAGFKPGWGIMCLGAGHMDIPGEAPERVAVRRVDVSWGEGLGWTVPEDVRRLWDEWVGEEGIMRLEEAP